jgi:hypothetical protein
VHSHAAFKNYRRRRWPLTPAANRLRSVEGFAEQPWVPFSTIGIVSPTSRVHRDLKAICPLLG